MGWEVKQHAVSNFDAIGSCVITLLTPEPNGGYYSTQGLEAFVRRFGYADTQGRADRLNFGGIYRVDRARHPRTQLTMRLLQQVSARSRNILHRRSHRPCHRHR